MVSIIITIFITVGVIYTYLYLYNKKERETEVQDTEQISPVKRSSLERPLIYEKPKKKKQTYISERDKNNDLIENNNVVQKIYIDEQLEMVQGNPLPFSDKGHLRNFINYLMRSDYAQRWTNKETEKCLMLFPSKPDKFYTMGNLDNRKKAAQILYNNLVDKSTTDLSHLAMRVTELENSEGYGITVDEEDDRISLMKTYILFTQTRDTEYKPVCFIEHSDGNNRPYHIHEILRKKSI